VNAFLLALHVLAAIVAVGPVCVAASMFPAAARRALTEPDAGRRAAVGVLERICRVYAVVGIAVPFFGLATAGGMHIIGEAWLLVSIALTAVAAAVLVGAVLPRQRGLARAVAESTPPASADEPPADLRLVLASSVRLAGYTGVFNLLWVTVTVLMILRPGSTTRV